MSHVHCSTVNEKEGSFPRKLCSFLRLRFYSSLSSQFCFMKRTLLLNRLPKISPNLESSNLLFVSLVSTIRPNSQCYRKMKIKMTQLMSFIITNDRCLSLPMSFAFLKGSQEFPDDFVANTVPIL